MQNDFAKIPQSLKALRNWVLWKLETRDNKPAKVPYQINGHRASASNSATWATFQEVAQRFSNGGYSGIGFVFSRDVGICGVDIDNCRDPVTGIIDERAQEIIKELSSYTEISQSGKGVHILVEGAWPYSRNRKGGVEVYNHERYFIVTGNQLPESTITLRERQAELKWLYETHLNGDRPKPEQPQAEHISTLEDEAIIRRCRKASNSAKFEMLYDNGDASDYEGDESRADCALCCIFAFWTRDFAQVDRLFRNSKLFRVKWDREDYRRRTIERAFELVTEFYSGNDRGQASEQFKEEDGSTRKENNEPTFEVVDFVDFLTKEIPPIEVILDPWLTTRSLNMIYAERGCGKTMITLAIAHAVASGVPFINKWPVLKKTSVCYFDGEMSAAEFQERCRGINLNQIERGQFRIVTNDFQPKGMPDFGTKAGQGQALNMIGDSELVIIDNLSCLLRSGGSENEAESWDAFQEWLLSLKRLGKTVLFLHHAGKSGAQRGTSKREDQLNEVVALRRPSGYKKSDGLWVQVKYEKGRRLFGKAAEPIEIKLETDILGRYVWKTMKIDQSIRDEILRLFANDMSAADIALELDVTKRYVNKIIKGAGARNTQMEFEDE